MFQHCAGRQTVAVTTRLPVPCGQMVVKNEVSTKIGFGMVAIHVTVHWSHFMRILLEAFELVSALASLLSLTTKQKITMWMEHLDGHGVLKGTASVGLSADDMATMANSKHAEIKPFERALIVVYEEVGMKSFNVETDRIDFDKVIGLSLPFTLQDKFGFIIWWYP